jgi:hypothetical protein
VGYAISKASDKPVAGGPAFDAGEEDALSKEQEKVTGGRADKGKPMRRKLWICRTLLHKGYFGDVFLI